MSVETAAIRAATAYALANGYPPTDLVAPGLVLLGMALGASLPPEARAEFLDGYMRGFPSDPAPSIDGWARSIAREAELE